MANEAGRVLVLDDEAELRSMLERYLAQQGLTVRSVADAGQLYRLLERERFDVLVLDLMMPGESGLQVCRTLRQQGHTLPILMLTARGDPADKVLGLEMGADDYLAKPFVPRELLARINAMLRRQAMLGSGPALVEATRIRFGDYELDTASRQLLRSGEVIALTSGEFSLLQVLASQPGRPLSRERLMELAYGRDHEATDRAIDVQILRLRRAIETDPANPRYIQTVRAVGYVFAPDGVPR